MKNSKLVTALKNLDLIFAGVALVVLVFTTFFDVIMRYVFSNPFLWEDEVQMWCFLWIVFFGAGAAFRTGNHIAIEFIVDAMKPKMKKFFQLLDWLVVIFVIGYFGLQSTTLVKQFVDTQEATSVLNVPDSVIYIAVPIGCLLMIIDYTIVMIPQLFSKNGPERKEDGK